MDTTAIEESTSLGEVVNGVLRDRGVTTACYVADHLLSSISDDMIAAPHFELLPVAREDEGLGILAGAYLGGQRGVMMMQSSGFALCANALGSLLLPYQIPVLMLVGLRGDLGEFNIAQVVGGQYVEPACRDLGVPYWAPASLDELARILPGAVDTCFATKLPVSIGIRRGLK